MTQHVNVEGNHRKNAELPALSMRISQSEFILLDLDIWVLTATKLHVLNVDAILTQNEMKREKGCYRG